MSDDWKQRYIDLHGAVWMQPSDEFPDDFTPEDHERTVLEAARDANDAMHWRYPPTNSGWARINGPAVSNKPWWKRLLETIRAYTVNEEPRQ